MKIHSKYFSAIFLIFAFIGASQNTITLAVKPSSTVASLPSLDLYGALPINNCGFGGGFNFLSKPLNVSSINYDTPIQLRVGGEFYFAELQHKNMGMVPLSAPLNGNARVRLSDDVFGLNAMARLSLPYSKKIIPYVDFFAGLRAFSANINITPEIHPPGNQQSTSDNLSTVSQFNYGATFGVMYSLGKWVKFNVGLMYTHSQSTGEIANIKKAYVESGSIITDKTFTVHDLLILKAGFTFLLQKNNSHNYRRCGTNRSSSGIHGSTSGGRTSSSHVNVIVRPSK